MGAKLTQEIRIPAWMLGTLVTLFLALATFTITRAGVEAAALKQIEVNTKVIEELKQEDKSLLNTKADNQDIKDIKGDIKEIKDLLYVHMGVKK